MERYLVEIFHRAYNLSIYRPNTFSKSATGTRFGLGCLSHPSHGSRAHSKNLRRLPQRDLFRHRPHYNFLYFHRPLHCGCPVLLVLHFYLRTKLAPFAAKSGQIMC